ncbi:Pkinase-domain-containing protein [Pseudovirgaria hyperparasitica]|uniref:Pkinase-domain-containing protein n=1 Tax=Pseudovirgaria hyperparasitica TaxID=470096 RepID=A0A6A6WFR6_9PEZI|nr:Pkinase-domain-containing protein [Pseudovirgaria hyperparasitica]KAF2761019.1 Pkinase-domain-containing protein [Pseudovirgaria hyperparasitica]
MLPTPPASPTLNGFRAPEDRLGQILAGRLQLTGILGVGAYGVVYTAVDIQTNIPYAVKALNKIGLEPRQRKFQEREISLHHRASAHPNVVSLVKIMDSPDCTFVVIEYCPEGDLFSNITECGKYVGNDELARNVFLQILDAVEYCHSIGIYHRDLKPENILVTDHGNTVKLADFGLATTDCLTSDFGCGSTFYMSPECHQSSPKAYSCYASAPNDIWSLGVILVNLTCGRNPWKRASFDDSTFRACMKDPKFLRSILPISAELDDVLKRIFELDPTNRITIPELRARIESCPSFSARAATASPAPQPPLSIPTSPYHHANYSQENVYAGAAKPSGPMVTLPSPPASPTHYTPPQYLHPDLSHGSAGSGCSSVFSACSSTSSASSTSSYVLAPTARKVPQGMFQPQASPAPCPAPNTWYSRFAPLAQTFQSTHLPQLRVY